jgi:hypothetical protein
MAVTVTQQLLNTLRNQYLTSLYGRRAGIDPNEYEIGPKDFRVQIENILTTAATTLSNFGITCLGCTVVSSAIYTLQGGAPGVQTKQIVQTSSSTLGYVIQAGSSVTFLTTGGSSFNQMTFACIGATQELIALSSLTWATKNTANSGVTFSTF